MPASQGSEFNGFALAHNLESEAEFGALFDAALRAGASAVKKQQKVFRGGYSGDLKDPDGHLWEIVHNPFAWVGPKDE